MADFAFRDRERKGIPLEEGEIGFLRCKCESGGSIGKGREGGEYKKVKGFASRERVQ